MASVNKVIVVGNLGHSLEGVNAVWPAVSAVATLATPFLVSLPQWAVIGLASASLTSLAVVAGRLWRARRFVTIDEAVVIAYDRLHGSIYTLTAERMAEKKTPESITDYMANLLADEIPIYAKHPPSTRIRLVDKGRVRRGRFAKGATVLTSRDGHEHTLVEPSVLRSDLRCALKRMEASGKSLGAVRSVEGLDL